MEADNNPDINKPNVETTAPAPQGDPEALATETTVMHRDIAEWHGRELIDCDGERIGKLEQVYFDVETNEPQFGTVKEGLFGRHLAFVPLAGVTIGPDSLQVPVTKEQIRVAPNIEQHDLSQADESLLYHHYQLNYTPLTKENGRRLARR
jgi:PRC-barrel domain